ncbi:hypothetical protein SDJN02_00795 [Cucurbita argyrosperma subsp. argyrosperma]|nr:hypothetical protein SDJN02_00795 [Cucurbita argyrosperma subsp. argyrosperma]
MLNWLNLDFTLPTIFYLLLCRFSSYFSNNWILCACILPGKFSSPLLSSDTVSYIKF